MWKSGGSAQLAPTDRFPGKPLRVGCGEKKSELGEPAPLWTAPVGRWLQTPIVKNGWRSAQWIEKLLSRTRALRGDSGSANPRPARIAIYDSLAAPPQILEVEARGVAELLGLLASKTYHCAQGRGGGIPFSVIKEVIENLIHAHLKDVVISVLDDGEVVRIADRGPGIADKEKAFEPGVSTATPEMRLVIRGVGSGLPIVREVMSVVGGGVVVDDNLGSGTVVTLNAPRAAGATSGGVPSATSRPAPSAHSRSAGERTPVDRSPLPLSIRQKRVLFLVTELGELGPSRVASDLNVSLSTAYRDLLYLEKHGLIRSDEHGRRSLTSQGIACLDLIARS